MGRWVWVGCRRRRRVEGGGRVMAWRGGGEVGGAGSCGWRTAVL